MYKLNTVIHKKIEQPAEQSEWNRLSLHGLPLDETQVLGGISWRQVKNWYSVLRELSFFFIVNLKFPKEVTKEVSWVATMLQATNGAWPLPTSLEINPEEARLIPLNYRTFQSSSLVLCVYLVHKRSGNHKARGKTAQPYKAIFDLGMRGTPPTTDFLCGVAGSPNKWGHRRRHKGRRSLAEDERHWTGVCFDQALRGSSTRRWAPVLLLGLSSEALPQASKNSRPRRRYLTTNKILSNYNLKAIMFLYLT